MRWLYIFKLLLRFPQLKSILPFPLKSLWNMLWGRDEHLLFLNGEKTLRRRITPPNIFGFLHLRKHGLKLASQQPEAIDQLLWQLSPSGTFLTRLTVGMDLMTLYELFGRKDYGEDFTDKVVVDVGAYNGDSAVYFALQGAKRVLALEPYKPNYELARENIQRMGLTERIKLLPYAFGAQRGRLRLHIAPASPDANALQPPESPLQKLIRYSQIEEVEVMGLEELLTELQAEEIDFLKLDCEGCEFAVIEGLPAESLRRVRTWHIEYHAKPQVLIEKLKAAGFEVRRERDRGGILGYLIAERK
ncbi:MAG: FkbM family methyltransferase [Bacteroidia bacterium]|nr:FkbM family methyltransferase [Bacteroidia bacterium]MCX7763613.1 FkbM family methyltransferase [Bacteroidia bacterium]